ncbi:ammonium transporter [Nocardioides ferulae]|uniref:ammonium transporter n=1 Tax=Nocardioides ferulae TaxID=2340821 RepID=UPI000EAFDBAF|nr:ammonium transporter [Nocardioides ferulae]
MDPTIAANADLAWLLAAFAIVALMFPGLALFYGGMMGVKSALNMMMMVLSTLGITSVLYVLYGYGMVSGPSVKDWGIIGDPRDYIGLSTVMEDLGTGNAETAYWAAFFILFAAITIAIVASGAAGRMKFSGWLVFSAVWLTLVYFPVAHWVFAFDGDGYSGGFLINDVKIHDYAGGTAVHMNSGVAALALAFVLGRRKGRPERPHNLPLTLLGGGILWFGWFGFNGGCAVVAGFLAQYVVMNTLLAGSAGMLGFLLVERVRSGHFTGLGLITGAIAGLVGITPSANTMSPLGALGVGLVAGAVVCLCLGLKTKLGIDDTLDAFAVHGLGGIAGTICIILFASAAAPAGVEGILLGGSWDIVWRELTGIAVTCTYSFLMTCAIAWVLDKTMGLRVDEESEVAGLDLALHAESAYDIHPVGGQGARLGALADRDDVVQGAGDTGRDTGRDTVKDEEVMA